MAGPQTSIGDAIGVAIKMTEHSKTQERLLVLLTDGNDTASKLPPHKAAEIAKQRGITIYTIGIGDPRAGGEQRVDLNALKRIAAATGGRSFRGEDRHGLEGIYRTIDETTPEKITRSIYRPKRALYYYPLGTAALLVIVYHLIVLGWTRAKLELRSTKSETRELEFGSMSTEFEIRSTKAGHEIRNP
jgi:Ca-activated chloride channel homolog